MLVELIVRDLGVIEELALVLGPGMTAVTGETGAGKTLVVEAIDLLVGGRADSGMVRTGAIEASVEGRFVAAVDGEEQEIVLRRVIPADGRSRAYANGHLATVGGLADWGVGLVDLHGQHDHQSLLATAAQRHALDVFGSVDLVPLQTAKDVLRSIDEQLAQLGGDGRERAREADLLRFQIDELASAVLEDPEEQHRLNDEERLLADALAHRDAAIAAVEHLRGDSGAVEGLSAAWREVADRSPFAPFATRLASAMAEVDDLVGELRSAGEGIDEDPERLTWVVQRRHLLRELCRKYGDTVGEVMAFEAAARTRLDEIEGRDERARALDVERSAAAVAVVDAAAFVGAARADAAPLLATAVETNLATLAMHKARVEIQVGPPPGDDVTFLLAANPGSVAAPLAKVASGGELARTMLALRLVLSEAPPTLVFDEVDAGVGGAAAVAVGRSLAQLGDRHQVLVVTHLPQVAAFADHQVVVRKEAKGRRTVTSIAPVEGEDRAAELARMLTGDPSSGTSLDNARDLLQTSARQRQSARMPRSPRPRRRTPH